MTTREDSAANVLEKAGEIIGGGRKTVRLGEVISGMGHSSMSAILLVPGMALVSPLSGVPLFSSACGVLIALVSGQMMLGRPHLWLPGWLERREIPAQPAAKAVARMKSAARWLDRHTGPRLGGLVRQPFLTVLRAVCALCGLAMPFLEVVPFSSSLLGAVVSVLAVAMLARDGLIALIALILLAAAGLGVPLLVM